MTSLSFFFPDEHLVQKSMADLFLDNPLYNAQSTAMDAAYAGLPLLVQAGTRMGERVGASILTALKVETLIARNRQVKKRKQQ